MHRADRDAMLGHLLLQLHQHNIRLGFHQTPDEPTIDSAGTTTLRNALIAAGKPLGRNDLHHPPITYIEAQRQLFHRALSRSIRRQYLAPKIITISSSHPQRIQQINATAKYLILYL